MNQKPILFSDGYCGFCNSMVRLMARLDRTKQVCFAPIQSKLGQYVIEQHPELRSVDTAFVMDKDKNGNERITWKAGILARLGEYVAWPAKLFFLPFKLLSGTIGDWIYELVAKYRYTFFPRYNTCPLPTPELRSRFADECTTSL